MSHGLQLRHILGNPSQTRTLTPDLFLSLMRGIATKGDLRVEKSHRQIGSELRVLSVVETQFVGVMKELSAELHDMFSSMGTSKEQEQAKLRLEEAVMWATKHVALNGHCNDPIRED